MPFFVQEGAPTREDEDFRSEAQLCSLLVTVSTIARKPVVATSFRFILWVARDGVHILQTMCKEALVTIGTGSPGLPGRAKLGLIKK